MIILFLVKSGKAELSRFSCHWFNLNLNVGHSFDAMELKFDKQMSICKTRVGNELAAKWSRCWVMKAREDHI